MMQLVETDSELAALWPEWQSLWNDIPDASPFLSPAWLRPWWRVFGTGAPLVSVLRRANGDMIALLPLYRYEDKLLPMGAGISDFFDVLAMPDAPCDAATLLLHAALHRTALPCHLPTLSESTALRDATAPSGWHVTSWAAAPCPVLELQPAPAIPAGMQRDIRQARHRAARAGGATVRTANAVTVENDLDTLIRLHGKNWRSRGQPGVLASADVLRFHHLAAPMLLSAGLLRLVVLHLRDAPAAAIHALVGPASLSFYIGGFDRACAFESPGTLLLAHMLEAAASEGCPEANFLRGGESYKYAWGARDRCNIGLALEPP